MSLISISLLVILALSSIHALDNKGNQLWRSAMTSKRNEWNGLSVGTVEVLIKEIATPIAELINDWAQELSRMELHHYAWALRYANTPVVP